MKPKFPPKKNGTGGGSRGGGTGQAALFLEKREQLIVAAVAVIREEREALGLSKRRAALRAKISPSQWGLVERRVNGAKEMSNRVTMGSNRSSLFNREELRLKNHGKRLSFSKDEDIFAFPEDRNGIPEDRFSELDERISFPEVRLAFSDDTF